MSIHCELQCNVSTHRSAQLCLVATTEACPLTDASVAGFCAVHDRTVRASMVQGDSNLSVEVHNEGTWSSRLSVVNKGQPVFLVLPTPTTADTSDGKEEEAKEGADEETDNAGTKSCNGLTRQESNKAQSTESSFLKELS